MRQKKRLLWGIVFLVAVVVAGMFWGVTALIEKLNQYSQSAVIGSEPSVSQQETPVQDDPRDQLPKNNYEPEGFYQQNGILYYDYENVRGVPGVDVSSYQTDIDWEAVRAAGIEFAMIQLGYRGYTTGKLFLDDCFLKHIEGALDAGLEVGVYFFSQALTPEEAEEEAEFVLTWLEGYDITYPVVYDWEEVEAEARTDQMNMLMLTACAQRFCEVIEDAGYEPAVYFNQAYGYQQLNLVSLKDYTFWLAEYSEVPTFYYDFEMWQYTNEGSVPGITGPVDLNIRFFEKE